MTIYRIKPFKTFNTVLELGEQTLTVIESRIDGARLDVISSDVTVVRLLARVRHRQDLVQFRLLLLLRPVKLTRRGSIVQYYITCIHPIQQECVHVTLKSVFSRVFVSVILLQMARV